MGETFNTTCKDGFAMWVEWGFQKAMYRQDWGTCKEKSNRRGQYLEWDTRDPDRHHVSPCLGFCHSPPPSPPSLGGGSELYHSQNHKIGQVISYTCITGHGFEVTKIEAAAATTTTEITAVTTKPTAAAAVVTAAAAVVTAAAATVAAVKKKRAADVLDPTVERRYSCVDRGDGGGKWDFLHTIPQQCQSKWKRRLKTIVIPPCRDQVSWEPSREGGCGAGVGRDLQGVPRSDNVQQM